MHHGKEKIKCQWFKLRINTFGGYFTRPQDREIITRPGTPKEKRFNGGKFYLLHYGPPQFFFHNTTAYAILRNNGIEIGKRDYMDSFFKYQPTHLKDQSCLRK